MNSPVSYAKSAQSLILVWQKKKGKPFEKVLFTVCLHTFFHFYIISIMRAGIHICILTLLHHTEHTFFWSNPSQHYYFLPGAYQIEKYILKRERIFSSNSLGMFLLCLVSVFANGIQYLSKRKSIKRKGKQKRSHDVVYT